MGDTLDHFPAHPRGPQECSVMHPSGGTQLLEYRQLQRCNGNCSWLKVRLQFHISSKFDFTDILP